MFISVRKLLPDDQYRSVQVKRPDADQGNVIRFSLEAERATPNEPQLARKPLLLTPAQRRAPSKAEEIAQQSVGLAQILSEQNAVRPIDLIRAIAMHTRQDCGLDEILLARGWVRDEDLRIARERIWNCGHIDPAVTPPDPRIIRLAGTPFCLENNVLPWRRFGDRTVVATASPEKFAQLKPQLQAMFGDVTMALCPRPEMHAALLALNHQAHVQTAETCVPHQESCRTLDTGAMKRHGILPLTVLVAATIFVPAWVFAVFCIWAVLTLAAFTVLKLAAATVQVRHARAEARKDPLEARADVAARLPRVSVMVPLFREKEIAAKLVTRLSRLNYPKELLEICLVTEADDSTTRQAIARANLPFWIRPVSVPAGELRTKPRALNFALDFCSGSIIGVYDAEDEPDPDQIHDIVRRFHERGPEVACLQGVLDYYNARTNWLSRCFTIEYATWFRMVLPGIMRLGFAIPLGGTTLFFRRRALEELGRWDAHNVTEDADLGVRLARHGYSAEIVETVTREEANCRTIPWIKQRSRWLKGYAATWAVHMRDPVTLWQQLGAWKFLGIQLIFFCTLSQFVLAPLLWSFWLVPLGLPHPLTGLLPQWGFLTLAGLFLFSELVTIAVGMFAVSAPEHRFLRWWVPTMHFYFPLGAFASYKGLWELISAPFYWDKTSHGHFDDNPPPASDP